MEGAEGQRADERPGDASPQLGQNAASNVCVERAAKKPRECRMLFRGQAATAARRLPPLSQRHVSFVQRASESVWRRLAVIQYNTKPGRTGRPLHRRTRHPHSGHSIRRRMSVRPNTLPDHPADINAPSGRVSRASSSRTTLRSALSPASNRRLDQMQRPMQPLLQRGTIRSSFSSMRSTRP